MITNPVELNYDQMEFMFTHYVEYAANPIPLMFWLFETACFKEEQEQMLKESEQAYNVAPKQGGKKVTGKHYNEIDQEDSVLNLNQ